MSRVAENILQGELVWNRVTITRLFDVRAKHDEEYF